MNFYILNQIIIFLINALGLALGLFVFLDAKNKTLHKIFVATVTLMLIWVDFSYAPRIIGPEYHNTSLVLLRIAWIATPLFFAALYFLGTHLTNSTKSTNLRYDYVIGALGIIDAVFAASKDFVVSGFSEEGSALTIHYGKGMWLYLSIVIITIIITLFVEIRKFRNITGTELPKMKFYLIGISIFYSANIIFNIILPIFFNITEWYWIGDYSTLVVLAFIAYAMYRYKLFDTKFFLSEVLLIGLNILVLIRLFFSNNQIELISNAVIFISILLVSFFALRNIHKESILKQKLLEVSKNLESTNEELKASIEKRSDLYANISHEFKTPITVLRGNVEMAVKNSDQKKVIDHELERMNKLTSELLELSKADSGKLELNITTCNFEELLRRIVQEVIELAEKRQIEIKTEIPKIVSIQGDQEKLYTLFLNLITNAIKYNKAGGSVKVSVIESQENAVVEISDTGIGISKEHLPKLFERFYRVDKQLSRKLGGTGLGLAIVKLMTELHGGTVKVESEEGKGTKFTVCLPKTHTKS